MFFSQLLEDTENWVGCQIEVKTNAVQKIPTQLIINSAIWYSDMIQMIIIQIRQNPKGQNINCQNTNVTKYKCNKIQMEQNTKRTKCNNTKIQIKQNTKVHSTNVTKYKCKY